MRNPPGVWMVPGVLLVGCGSTSPALPDAAGLVDGPTVDARGVDAAVPDAAPMLAVSLDFEGPSVPAGVSPGTGTLTPSQGYAPLGPAGNTFGPTFLRSPTGNTVILATDLPPHSSLSLSFLFAAIDSLDGTGTFPAGDFLRVTLDGTEIFYESFANATPDQIQSYQAPAGGELARRVDLGFAGPGGFYTDNAYNMSVEPRFWNLPHSATTAALEFTLVGEGVQSLDDESWALDNLRITVNP